MAQGDYFFDGISQYAPMATSKPFTPITGFEGMPWGDNPLLAMALQPLVGSFMAQSGMAPMGLHDRNVFDVMQNQRFWKQQMQAQQQVAEADRSNWMRTMRGMAAVSGTPWGADQMRAANGLSDAMVTASPFLLQMMPNMLDEIAGPRGSAAVLADQMMLAGRYRVDPVSGRVGQSPEHVAAVAKTLYDKSFGPDADFSRMQGISAGQYGQLYSTLQSKGMLAGLSGSPRDLLRTFGNDQEIKNAASSLGVSDVSKATPDQVDKLLNNQVVGDRLRSFDADKTKRSVDKYLSVVNAMRDIFGEMGQPNAPMNQLIEALEAMTNGAMGQINPERLNSMVRMSHQLASSTGIGLDNFKMLQDHASQRANALGLEPVFGVQAAQGAAAYGGAYRALGLGAHTAWGRMNADQLTQLDAHLQVNAAASQAAQRMGAVVRITEQGGIDKNSELGQYAEALKTASATGERNWTFNGQTRSINMSERDVFRMAGAAGINASQFSSLMSQQFANREAIQEYDLGAIVRAEQGRTDVRPWLQQQFQSKLHGQLSQAGVDSNKARKAAAEASGTIVNRIMDLDSATFANNGERTAAMSAILSQELAAKGIDTSKFSKGFFEKQAVDLYGFWGEAIQHSPDFNYLRNPQNMFLAFNEPVQQQAQRIKTEQRLTAEVKTVLAPLNRGSMVRRAMGYLQEAGDKGDGDLAGLISSSLGGVSIEQVNKNIIPVFREVQDEQKRIDVLMTKLSQATDSTERADLVKQIQDRKTHLQSAADKAQSTLDMAGVGDAMLSSDELNRASNLRTRSDAGLAQVQAELAKGKDGKPLTDKQRSQRMSAFWATDSGRQLQDTLRAEGSAAEDVAAKAVMSDTTLRKFGTAGIDQAKQIQAGNQQLREMAIQYTGGDVAKLIAGDLDPSLDADTRKKVDDQVKTARTSVAAGVTWFRDRMGQDGRQWDADATAKRLGVTKSAVEQAMKMTEADVKAAEQLTKLEKQRDDVTKAGGKITPELQKRLDEATTAVAETDKRIGGSSRESLSVFEKIKKEAQAVQRTVLGDARTDAAALLESFGINNTTDEDRDRLAGAIKSERGQATASLLLSKRKRLSEMGRKKGVKGDNAVVMDELYTSFKKDRGQFEQTYDKDAAADMELQERMGVAEIGRDKQRFNEAINSAVATGGQQKVEVKFPDKLAVTLNGTLDVKNGQMAAQGQGSPGKDHAVTTHGGDNA